MADLLPPVIATLRADIGDFDSKMGKALGSLQTMQTRGASGFDQFARVGKVAFTALSAAAVGFGAYAVKQAAEQEEANARLTTALKNAGSQMTATSKPVEDLSDKLIKLGFDDADTADSLAKLTNATHDPTKALRDESLAADVARGRHIDLAAATDILTKVETGHVALLGRIGINTKDATGATISQQEALKRLSEMYGGQASAYAGTFAGKMAILKAETSELAERVGFLLIPVIEKVAHDLSVGADWLGHHTNAAKALAVVVGGPLVIAMGAYVAQQAASVGLTAIQVASRLPQMFLSLGAAIRGTTAADVVLNESMAATNGTMLLGAGAIGAAIGGMIALTAAGAQSRKETDAWAKSLIAGTKSNADSIAITKVQLADAEKKLNDYRNSWKSLFYDLTGGAKLQDKVGSLKQQLSDLKGATFEQGRQATSTAIDNGELTDSLDGQTTAAADATKALDTLKTDTMGLYSAQKGLKDAQQGVTTAVSAAQDAHQRLNDLMKKSAVDTKAVEGAQRDLDSSTRRLTDAQDALTTARKKFDDLLAGPSVRDQTDANLKIQDTTDGVQRAQIRLREAQTKLTTVQKDNTSTADDLTSAQLDVNDATRGVTTAQEAASDAQQSLTDLMNAGKEGSQQYTDARKNVSDAEQAVKDAQQGVLDSQQKLTDAQKGDVTLAQQIADARKGVADAERGVSTAKDAVTTSTLNLYDAQQKENDALAQGGQAALDYLTYLQGIVDANPQLANDPILGMLRGFVAPKAQAESNLTRFGQEGAKKGPSHAAGGPVSAGVLYPVNERSTEYFQPNSGGRIIPLAPYDAGGGPSIGSVTINVNGSGSPTETARAVQAELLRLQRRNGTTGIR